MTQPLEPGTLVVCTTRMPSINQPWIHPIYVGVIEETSTDPTTWNGNNSEREYCQRMHKARVCYDFDVQYDSVEQLIPITVEQAELSPREKIALFLGEEARLNYDRAHSIR